MDDAAADDLVALGLLAEPQRARIYAYLASAAQPQTRQEVCEALEMGRTLVAFHLGKLQAAGLVNVTQSARPVGGQGRPPHRYAVTDRELVATVPPRRYELIAEVLVRAAREQAPGETMHTAAARVARARGAELAAQGTRGDLEDPRPQDALMGLFARLGYEPTWDGDDIVLTNCPFQRLRVADTELVCSINAALSDGYLVGLALNQVVSARLRPCPINCCVVLEPTG